VRCTGRSRLEGFHSRYEDVSRGLSGVGEPTAGQSLAHERDRFSVGLIGLPLLPDGERDLDLIQNIVCVQ